MSKLNHSRYIDNGAQQVGKYAYDKEKATPTYKQVKFYKKLYAMCKEHNVDPNTNETHSRAGLGRVIDILIERLEEKGIDIKTNGKPFSSVLMIGSDKYGNYYSKERLVHDDDLKHNQEEGD